MFVIESDDVSLVTNPTTKKDYSVTCELTDWPTATYPTAPSDTKQDIVQFIDGCLDPPTFTAPAQGSFTGGTVGNDASVSTYNGDTLEYTVPAFTISPARCTVTITCTSLTFDGTGGSRITCNTEGFTFSDGSSRSDITPTNVEYEGMTNPPGTYTVTFTGLADASTAQRSLTTTALFTLKDVCNPATVTAVALTDQSYIVSKSPADTYTHPNYSVTPSYCGLSYEYDIG